MGGWVVFSRAPVLLERHKGWVFFLDGLLAVLCAMEVWSPLIAVCFGCGIC